MADERAAPATPDRLASTPASYVRDLLVIGDAAIRWRQLAEQMERGRNAAHQEIVALDALAARLTADLAAERARSERLREAGERLHSELLDVAFGWDLGLPQRCQDDAHVALDAWDAAADDAQRDGQEGTMNSDEAPAPKFAIGPGIEMWKPSADKIGFTTRPSDATLVQFISADQGTGWFTLPNGCRGYCIDGESVSRQTWISYVADHPEMFSDPVWTEEG